VYVSSAPCTVDELKNQVIPKFCPFVPYNCFGNEFEVPHNVCVAGMFCSCKASCSDLTLVRRPGHR